MTKVCAVYACFAALMAGVVTATLRGSVQIKKNEDNLAVQQADQEINTRAHRILLPGRTALNTLDSANMSSSSSGSSSSSSSSSSSIYG